MRRIIPMLPLMLWAMVVPSQAHAFFFLAALPTWAIAATAALTVASTAFTAISARKQAKAEAAQLELNAKMEGTAALQRDTIRREELERTLGTIRAARGGTGLTSPTAISFLQEANERINSDRTVELLNSRQRQADLRQQARQARARGRNALISGAVQGGLSLFQAGLSGFGGGGFSSAGQAAGSGIGPGAGGIY